MTFLVLTIVFVCLSMGTQTFAVEYKTLGQSKIPLIGMGTYGAKSKEEFQTALNAALELGYRHIDTATLYNNEHWIGETLKEWFSAGKLKREDVFITTKLSMNDLYAEKVEEAIKTSLSKLQLDFVDLWLMHAPFATKNEDNKSVPQPSDFIAVWKKMEEQVDAGRVKNIGLSSFNSSQIAKIQSIARIQPVALQVEAHVYFQQRALRAFAKKHNIVFIGFSPLGSPGLSKVRLVNFDEMDILSDPKIGQIAKKHNKSPAQVLLRFLIQSDIIPIPKSFTPKRLKENLEVFDFVLDSNDLETLESLDKGKAGRITTFNMYMKHEDYPFRSEEVVA